MSNTKDSSVTNGDLTQPQAYTGKGVVAGSADTCQDCVYFGYEAFRNRPSCTLYHMHCNGDYLACMSFVKFVDD